MRPKSREGKCLYAGHLAGYDAAGTRGGSFWISRCPVWGSGGAEVASQSSVPQSLGPAYAADGAQGGLLKVL